jgi:hypothetical protein
MLESYALKVTGTCVSRVRYCCKIFNSKQEHVNILSYENMYSAILRCTRSYMDGKTDMMTLLGVIFAKSHCKYARNVSI